MANQNDNKSYIREQHNSYNDANGHAHASVTRTEETVNNSSIEPKPTSYRDGYVHGRVAERHNQQEDLADRDNNTAARGLLLGILLTSLAGLTAGALFLLNQRNEAPVPATPPVIVPGKPAASPSPQANQAPQKQTTVIERTREVPVVVPQPQAPASQPSAPNVNISVPNPASQPPANPQAPSTQTAPTQSQSQTSTQSGTSTTPAQETQSNPDSSTDTSAQDTSSQPETTSGSSPSPATDGNTDSPS